MPYRWKAPAEDISEASAQLKQYERALLSAMTEYHISERGFDAVVNCFRVYAPLIVGEGEGKVSIKEWLNGTPSARQLQATQV